MFNPPPIEHFFGRNSVAPGNFREFFGCPEPRDRCATFERPRLPMVRPPAAAIRHLLVLGGLGDFKKFRGTGRGPNGSKTPKKWIFPVLGAVLDDTPADQICLHAKCRHNVPCLTSHVPLRPGIWPFGGGEAGGRFVVWGPVLSVGNPTDKKPFRPELGATGAFSGTAFALRNFLTLTMLGSFTRVFRENRDLLVFGGVWALREIPGLERQKPLDPKTIKKTSWKFVFCCRFKKCVFVKNGVIFFRFRPLVSPIGAVHTEKT